MLSPLNWTKINGPLIVKQEINGLNGLNGRVPNYDVLDNCKKESVKITQLKFNGTISQNMKDCRVVDLKKLKLKKPP